jgi:hypothetical protein
LLSNDRFHHLGKLLPLQALLLSRLLLLLQYRFLLLFKPALLLFEPALLLCFSCASVFFPSLSGWRSTATGFLA